MQTAVLKVFRYAESKTKKTKCPEHIKTNLSKHFSSAKGKYDYIVKVLYKHTIQRNIMMENIIESIII